MAGSMALSALHVEGPDDKHSLIHLLIRHGIDYDQKPWPAEFPEFKQVGGVTKLLEGMEDAIKASAGRAIGFVLDAETPLSSRWQAVRDKLEAAGLTVPQDPPGTGFVAETPKDARVGVWLMPDNQREGSLEDFLRDLVSHEDPLINHAEAATDTAKTDFGASFRPQYRSKAVLHAWLAWQEEPGKPYGVAMQARYFDHDAQVAEAFVAWFKRLYRIN